MLKTQLQGDKMAAIQKQRPAHVPAENEYHSVHWSVILTYLAAAAALYLLLSSE